MDITEQDAISLSNIIILGRLGRGATSHVFRVQYSKNKKVYAMKVMDKKDKFYNKQSFQRQIDIQRSLSHKNIVELVSHIEDMDNHYVLTQYCQAGEITKLIMEDMDEFKIKKIVYEIAQGLDYMHGKGIAHCDLKLSNLLVQNGQVKICDFGFSRQIDAVKSTNEKSLYGTLFYLAPEIMKQNQRIYFQQGDVWAFGIMILIMITKKQPYTGKTFKQIRKQILEGTREPLPLEISQSLRQLVQSMLEQDPLKRISLKEIMNHSFLQEIRTINIKIKVQSLKKIQQKTEHQWQFKRKKNQKTQGFDQTKQKVYKITESSQNNDKTIKKPSRYASKSEETNEKEEKLFNENEQMKQKTINAIEARLIRPLGEYKYETKNDGFIKILKNGDLEVKVKNICYSIIKNGNVLKLQNRQYQFSKLKQQQKSKGKKLYELYEYAYEVIDILKKKNFQETYDQKRNGKQILYGLNRKQQKIILLAKVNHKLMTIEYRKDYPFCHIKYEGQKVKEVHIQNISELQIKQYFDLLEKKLSQLLE